MVKIKRFEDIEAWKKARELTQEIYAVSNEGSFARDFGLRDQIRRAAVSVISNSLYRMATEAGNLIGGFMRYLTKGGSS